MNRIIYLDHAATTTVSKQVLDSMIPYFSEQYGNPGTIYSVGVAAKSAVNKSRDSIADTLCCNSSEIYFTSGGTESDNWAIKSVARMYANKGKHIITSKIEHHAVLNTCEYLKQYGFEITYLNVDENGFVSLKELEEAIRPDTILISIMAANNEIGTIQPIEEIGTIAHKHGVLFHTDAVQAYGQIPISVKECHIDLLSASGHKLKGPKGVGFLYVNSIVKLGALLHGGQQERYRRAGTENVPAIVGLATASRNAYTTIRERKSAVTQLREYLIENVLSRIPDVTLNGDRNHRLPGNVNFCFEKVNGESMLIMLDMEGICASSGAACASGSLDASHVLLAIGMSKEKAKSSLRFSLDDTNTKEEIDIVVDKLEQIVKKLRG